MTIEIKPWSKVQSWDEYVAAHPAASLYHTSAWLEVAETFGVTTHKLGVWEQDRLVGAMPLVQRKMGPMSLAGSPLNGISTPHMGPLLDTSIRFEDFLQALEKYAKAKGIDYLELALADESGQEALRNAGYTLETRQTLLLDIASNEEELWQGMEVRCRNATRKAEKSGVEVEFCTTLDSWLKDYMAMSDALYERQGMKSPFTESYFRTLWEKFYPDNLVVAVARYEGKAIAAALFPRFRNSCYYVDGVSWKEYNKVNPNNIVQWRFLQWASANGVTFYDMVGANIPPIAKFKASFGSKYHSYTYAYRSLNWRSRLGRQAYVKYGPVIKRFIGKKEG